MNIQSRKAKSGIKYRARIMKNGKTYTSPWTSTKTAAKIAGEKIQTEIIISTIIGTPHQSKAAKAKAEKEQRTKNAMRIADYVPTLIEREEIRANSLRSLNSLFNAHILPNLGAVKIVDFTGLHVSQLKKYADAKGYKPVYTQNIIRALMWALNKAYQDEIIPAPVKHRIKIKKSDRRRQYIHIATPRQLAALSAGMPEKYSLAVLLAAWCSLRLGEVLALSRKDMVKIDGNYTVNISRAWVSKARAFGAPKTAAGVRKITTPAAITPLIDEHLATYTGKNPASLLFADSLTGIIPVADTTFRNYWNKAKEAVYLEDLKNGVASPLPLDFRFHDLRHTGLTLYAQQGATTAELMRRGGHTSVETALIYQHAANERDQALTAKLDSLVEV